MFLTPSCFCREHFPDSVLALYAFGLGRAQSDALTLHASRLRGYL
jgi:hypothetical protein